MREATPPWRFPPASRAGTGAGPWRRPERRIGKPGEIRRRKVTGLMSQSVPMGPRAHAAPAGRGGRGGAGKRRRLCPPGRRTQSGLCGDDVRRTAGGKLWETIGRKGWTFPAEAPRKLHGAPWQVRGMVARPPDPLHPTNMMCLGMLPTGALAASNFNITFRIFCPETGEEAVVGYNNSVSRPDDGKIQVPYRIPYLSSLTDYDYGRVTEVRSNAYFGAKNEGVSCDLSHTGSPSGRLPAPEAAPVVRAQVATQRKQSP